RASHDFGGVYIAGAAAYGLSFVSTGRAVLGETYTAAFTAQSLSGRAEIGGRWKTAIVDVMPFAAARAISFSTPGYGETGSGAGTFALAYRPATTLAIRSEIGLGLKKTVASASGATTFAGRLGWAHSFTP